MRRVVVGVAVGIGLVVVAAAPAQAEYVEGLRYEADVTFELLPSDERVRVTGEITVTNQVPDQGSYYYYFDEVPVHLPAEATNFTASRPDGGTLSTHILDEDHEWIVRAIRLPSDLLYPQTQRLTFSYDLPNLPPRSAGWTRATDAAASFGAFAIGDPGLSSVTIVVPRTFTWVEVGGEGWERTAHSEAWHYTATEIEKPDEWWVAVAAHNDDGLAERDVSVGDDTIVLRYWPGDEEWADFAEQTLVDGIPVLEELIGLPWPVTDELEVIESSIPEAFGYHGWYDAVSRIIEVSEDLDPATMLHELAHVWFNQRVIDERWLTEGLAELYAHAALERLDGAAEQPEDPPDAHPAEMPLADWIQAPFDGADEYVYPVAWWVMAELRDEIGDDGMRAVIGALAEREISYRSELPVETIVRWLSWRRVLDLLVEVGGSEQAEDLFAEYVLGEDDAASLAERAEARAAYADLVADAGDWTAPLALRQAMTLWEFDRVDGLADQARDVLAYRDEVLDVLAIFGVDELPALAEAYHGATSIGRAADTAETYAVVAAALAAAQEPPAGVAGVLARVGLFGTDLDAQLADAATSLGSGDVDEAGAIVDGVVGDVGEATVIGGVVAAQLALAALLFWPLRRLAVRRREPSVLALPVGS